MPNLTPAQQAKHDDEVMELAQKYAERVLELALKSVASNFNDFLEICDQRVPTHADKIRARACIPKGYSMTLVKEQAK